MPLLIGDIAQSLGSIGYARGYAVYVILALVSLLFTGLLYATRHGVDRQEKVVAKVKVTAEV